MDTIVSLGGFFFIPTTFAVPEEINGGGRQQISVHRLIGGTRVLDAMGWNDDQIRMKGRFRGALADIQRRLLETIVRSGKPVVFSYWTNRYQVVGSQFLWRYERYYEITYELTLDVISDLTMQVFQQIISTLDNLIDSDGSLASAWSNLLPNVSLALAAFATARAAVGVLQGASKSTVAPVTTAVATAQQKAASQQALLNAEVQPSAGGVIAGGNAGTMAAGLNNQAFQMQQLEQSVRTGAVLGRMSTNLATAPI